MRVGRTEDVEIIRRECRTADFFSAAGALAALARGAFEIEIA
jgi:hypothetical protein